MTSVNDAEQEAGRCALPLPDAAMKVVGAFTPYLLLTESLDAYRDFRDAVLDDLAPQSAVEATLAMRYIECCWKIERYRRVATGITNITYRQALIDVLREFGVEIRDNLTPEAIADKWVTDKGIRGRVLEHLRRFAISEQEISAQAMAMRSREVMQFDEMVARTEIQALAILRELDRRREVVARCAVAQLAAERAGESTQIAPPTTGEVATPLQQAAAS